MTTRLLPREEWDARLKGTELESAIPALPHGTQVLVVEDGATVIGCWSVIPYVHVEGVWIHPTHRGRGRVAARLLSGMRAVARGLGAQAVWTAAMTDDVRGLITRLGGQKLPGEHFVMPVGRE